jgi:putative hydrolase of the HAD superfamily
LVEHVYIVDIASRTQMTEEFDAIVFDAGGTLIDMRPTRTEVFADVLHASGFEIDPAKLEKAIGKADRTLDEEFARLNGGDDSEFWKKFDTLVLKEIGFVGDVDHVYHELTEKFNGVMPKIETWVDYPETKGVLRYLRKRGFTLGVISNATELVNRVLDNLDLTMHFDFVIVSDEVGVNKPSAEIFMMAADKARTSPNRMLFIGDKLSTDVKGAVDAGMNAILVDRVDAYPDVDCIRIRDLDSLRLFL